MTKIYFIYIYKKTQKDTSLVFSKKRSKGERLNLRSGHVNSSKIQIQYEHLRQFSREDRTHDRGIDVYFPDSQKPYPML